jgi:hypothetical protein
LEIHYDIVKSAYRGIAGFSAKSHIHSAFILDISSNLPLVIEAVDTESAIQQVLPKFDEMITDDRAIALKYRIY